MIIHPVRTTISEDTFTLASTVTWEATSDRESAELWFRIPVAYKDLCGEVNDAFAVSLLPAAMRAGERVHVDGPLSARLLYNQREYQRILNFWLPEEFSLVSVTCDAINANAVRKERSGALSSCSGGIDSSYTIFSHLRRNEPHGERQVTHAFFLCGFDTNEDKRTHAEKIDALTELLQPENITLIPVETNVREFYTNARIAYCYSAIICGAALLFASALPRFYFSEDHTYDFPPPFSLHHLLAPLLSTERMRISGFGGSATKLEKVRKLSSWNDLHSRLVVCHEHPNSLRNCGCCTKCCLTMSALSMEGVLERFPTFPPRIDRRAVRRGRFVRHHFCFPKQWIAFGWSKGRYDIVADYSYALAMSWLQDRYETLLPHAVRRWLPSTSSFNPLVQLYRISYVLKQRWPAYARFIMAVKSKQQPPI